VNNAVPQSFTVHMQCSTVSDGIVVCDLMNSIVVTETDCGDTRLVNCMF